MISFHLKCQDTSKVLREESLLKYFIYDTFTNYPQEAIDAKIQGTIILIFDIDSTCSIVNRREKNKLGYGCDEAAFKDLDKVEEQLKKHYKNKCKPSKNVKMPIKFGL